MTRTIKKLTDIMEYLAAAGLVLMMVHVVLDVAGKWFFNMPMPAATEFVAYYYMISAVFLPLAFVEIRGRSISVDLFYNHFSTDAKRAANGFGLLCAMVFFGALTYKTSIDAWAAFQKGEFVRGFYDIPIWPARFFLPVSFFLTTLVVSMRFVHEVIFGGSVLVEADKETETESIYEGVE